MRFSSGDGMTLSGSFQAIHGWGIITEKALCLITIHLSLENREAQKRLCRKISVGRYHLIILSLSVFPDSLNRVMTNGAALPVVKTSWKVKLHRLNVSCHLETSSRETVL